MRTHVLLATLILSSACASAGRTPPFNDPTARPQREPTKAFDVEHYRIRLYADHAAATVHGVTDVAFQFPGAPGRSITLDAEDMEVHSVTAGDRAVSFTHEGRALRIAFEQPAPADTLLNVTIAYTARPEEGLYFVGPNEAEPNRPPQVWSQGEPEYNHRWFPCWDHPNDTATSEVIMLVPDGWTVISNGLIVDRRPTVGEDWAGMVFDRGPPHRGFATWHWRLDFPHVSYLVSVIAGPTDTVEDRWNEVVLTYNTPRGMSAADDVRRNLGVSTRVMEWLSAKTGVPYPYPRYAQSTVLDFMWGGMENISATTLNHDRTIYDAAVHPDRSPEGLIVHEMAHQWFGDYVTCRTWAHIWLNESFATYYTDLYWLDVRGEDAFRQAVFEGAEAYMGEADRYARPIVNNVYSDPDQMFDSHTYPGGAARLHMIRHVIGAEAFDEAIHNYLVAHAGNPVETGMLREAFEEASGLDLRGFFRDWIYGAGYPRFRVTSAWEEVDSTTELTVTIEQTQPGAAFTSMPVDLRLHGASTQDVRVELTGRRTVWRAAGMARPTLVEFDPWGVLVGRVETTQTPEELRRQVMNGSSVVSRIRAIRALPEGSESIVLLTEAYGVGPSESVRREIVRKAAALQAWALVVRALSDPEVPVREAAASSLASAGTDEAFAALTRAAESDARVVVRAEALKSIGSYGDRGREFLTRRVAATLHREEIRAAVEGLGRTGSGAFEAVRDHTSRRHNSWIRTAAIGALGGMSDRAAEAVAVLTGLLGDGNFFVERDAIRALGRLGGEAEAQMLLEREPSEPNARLRAEYRQAAQAIRDRGH